MQPKTCPGCRARPVAWTRPRVDYCYSCLPGGPFRAPPCTRCGSGLAYYSQGRCTRCHPSAPQQPGSCRDCLAWGVVRKHKWLCWRCRGWRAKYPRGICTGCTRPELPLGPAALCTLCDRQTLMGPAAPPTGTRAQQLYLANLPWPPRRALPAPASTARACADAAMPFHPVPYTQLLLLNLPRDLRAARARGGFGDPPNEQMAASLDAAVRDHARRHGWSSSTTHRTRTGMQVLLTLQDSPGNMLLASDAMLLHQIDLNAARVIDVATAAGLMLDDRQPAIHAWFATTTADLPAPMRTELTQWFDLMLHGSTTPPRRRPRGEQTTRHYLRWAMPALTTWAAQGHTSLRQISTADVRAVLPPAGNPRSTMGAGLRSILTLLKAAKVLFVNPIARVRTGGHERRDPLPTHAEQIRQALLSPDPACAALTALATFHGLRAGELRTLHLHDLSDGRVRLPGRTILLADPVTARLNAWLEHRNRRWPGTANPHVFLNHRNATGTTPVGGRWLTLTTGIPIHVLREDRILNETRASAGDVRRICDLFGLSVDGALRYLPHPEPEDLEHPWGTRAPAGS